MSWFDDTMASLLARTGASAGTAAVIAGGEVVHLAGHGRVGLESQARPTGTDDAFRIGSITKTMTAVAAMTLVEKGKLGLDDPVNQHLRHFEVVPPPGGRAVTVRHLLTHTSGLGDFPGWRNLGRPGALALVGGAPPALSVALGPAVRAEVPAGAKYSYSQRGLAIAGQVIEDVSGTPFRDYVAGAVFDPLGMASASIGASDRTGTRLIGGYSTRTGAPRRVRPREFVLAGAGGGIATARDLEAYASMLLGEGANDRGEVLTPAGFTPLVEPHYRVSDGFPALGLTFWLERLWGVVTFGHGGMYPGFAAYLVVVPGEKVAVALAVNATAFPSLTAPCFVADAARAMLARLAGGIDPTPDRAAVESDPAGWHQLQGHYRLGPGFVTNGPARFGGAGGIAVRVREGGLWLRPFPATRAIELHPSDPGNPLRFRATWFGRARPTVDVVFTSGVSGDMASLHLAHPGFGFVTLSKRQP